MKRIYTRIPRAAGNKKYLFFRLLLGVCLLPIFLLIAHLLGLPGIFFHLISMYAGIRLFLARMKKRSKELSMIYSLIFAPMDAVRYFEFGFTWREVSQILSRGSYLDISSPRIFPIGLMLRIKNVSAILLNPDRRDVELSREIIDSLNLQDRCLVHNCMIEEVTLPESSFDLISLISVLEHIPSESIALSKIWNLLKPGGNLVMSVPCAAEAFVEYTDFDEYGLYEKDQQGFVFGQRIYDDEALNERIFRFLGKPVSMKIIGEKRKGTFFKEREKKNQFWHNYPHWKEPYKAIRQWKTYQSLSDLPGLGVIILKFQKTVI